MNTDDLQKKIYEKYNKAMLRCYQKPGNLNIAQTFYSNFNQSSISQQNNFRIIFSR